MKKNIIIFSIIVIFSNYLNAADDFIKLTGQYTNNMIILNWKDLVNESPVNINIFKKNPSSSFNLLTHFQGTTTSFTDRNISSPIHYFYKLTVEIPANKKIYKSHIIKIFKKNKEVSISKNKSVKIYYTKKVNNKTEISVRDKLNHQIAYSESGLNKVGLQEFIWDLKNLYGIPVPVGKYKVFIKTGNQCQTNHILLVP